MSANDNSSLISLLAGIKLQRRKLGSKPVSPLFPVISIAAGADPCAAFASLLDSMGRPRTGRGGPCAGAGRWATCR